jgi:acyl-coenzyme A thioesterase PaaI-like protein
MTKKAIQDHYPDNLNQCYGCGGLNEHGLQIKSYWEGEEAVCIYEPKPYHTAFPGVVYGGMIASLIDCNSTAAAAAATCRSGNQPDDSPPIRFLTASLHVDYILPTPLGVPLEIRSRIAEIKGRKVVVESTLGADGKICARGKLVAVQVPDHLVPDAG